MSILANAAQQIDRYADNARHRLADVLLHAARLAGTLESAVQPPLAGWRDHLPPSVTMFGETLLDSDFLVFLGHLQDGPGPVEPLDALNVILGRVETFRDNATAGWVCLAICLDWLSEGDRGRYSQFCAALERHAAARNAGGVSHAG